MNRESACDTEWHVNDVDLGDGESAAVSWQRQGLGHVEADKAIHFCHEWSEVVGFFAADVGELV